MHAGVHGTFSFKRKTLELIIGGKKKDPANALSRGMLLCVLGEAGSSHTVWDTEGFPCHSRRPTGAASLPEKPGKPSQTEHRGPYRGLLKVDASPKEMDFHRRQLSERETPPAVHIFLKQCLSTRFLHICRLKKSVQIYGFPYEYDYLPTHEHSHSCLQDSVLSKSGFFGGLSVHSCADPPPQGQFISRASEGVRDPGIFCPALFVKRLS